MQKRKLKIIRKFNTRNKEETGSSNSAVSEPKNSKKKVLRILRRKRAPMKKSAVVNTDALNKRHSDGSEGYGNITSNKAYTSSNAPRTWRGKFGYYFNYYPESLQKLLQMDQVASFSVTEARFAQEISILLSSLDNLSESSFIVDATAGVGGNSMSFINHFNLVFSIELDSNTATMLDNNLTHAKRILRSRGNFNVINGDFLELIKNPSFLPKKADIIFMDPPWGGMAYKSKKDIRLKLSGLFMSEIANSLKSITNYVALKLPVNYDIVTFAAEIASNNGEIIINRTIKDRRMREKMKIIIVKYNREEVLKKTRDEIIVNQEDKSLNSTENEYDLSKYPLHFDNKTICDSQKRQFPVITNPNKFYHLLKSDITLDKKVTVDPGKKPSELNLPIYKNLNKQSIINTFNYLFYKIRMGIFVYIKDNQLKYFIPFQNMNFRNNWSQKIKFMDSINNFNEYIHNKSQYIEKPVDTDLENDIEKWSANNCLIGNWTSNEIGDMGWYELREILTLTCKQRRVNDCIFFFNRRDHPVLTKNKTEPYFHLFDSINTPLDSHNYENYVPILSYSKNDDFADILFPTYADWRNITGKVYPSSCTDMNMGDINLDWDRKKPQGVFRGSATGCGTTPEDNQRIKLSWLSNEWNKRGFNNIIDGGLVGTNLRDKKFMGKPLSFFRYKDYSYKFLPRMPMNLQSNFKYIIHIDGHVSAYRLGKELSLGSCILKVDSLFNYRLWFSKYLLKNKHYIAIQSNLNNLGSIIQWCKVNDPICKQIAQNAGELYENIMNVDFILDFTTNIVNSISENYII